MVAVTGWAVTIKPLAILTTNASDPRVFPFELIPPPNDPWAGSTTGKNVEVVVPGNIRVAGGIDCRPQSPHQRHRAILPSAPLISFACQSNRSNKEAPNPRYSTQGRTRLAIHPRNPADTPFMMGKSGEVCRTNHVSVSLRPSIRRCRCRYRPEKLNTPATKPPPIILSPLPPRYVE